jgi:hypothetical protein
MRRSRFFWLAATCSVLVSASGCGKSSSALQHGTPSDVRTEPKIQPHPGEPPDLVFDMKLSNVRPIVANSPIYDCTYQARGTTARFRVQIAQGAMSGEIPTASMEGKFLAVAGSDDTALLEDLEKTLDAKQSVKNVTKIPDLAFDGVVLGERQRRNPSGGYFSSPPGDWTTTKIFLPKGGDDGEVFFNFNPVLDKGEFSIKDSDYGDYVLKELAKVL